MESILRKELSLVKTENLQLRKEVARLTALLNEAQALLNQDTPKETPSQSVPVDDKLDASAYLDKVLRDSYDPQARLDAATRASYVPRVRTTTQVPAVGPSEQNTSDGHRSARAADKKRRSTSHLADDSPSEPANTGYYLYDSSSDEEPPSLKIRQPAVPSAQDQGPRSPTPGFISSIIPQESNDEALTDLDLPPTDLDLLKLDFPFLPLQSSKRRPHRPIAPRSDTPSDPPSSPEPQPSPVEDSYDELGQDLELLRDDLFLDNPDPPSEPSLDPPSSPESTQSSEEDADDELGQDANDY